MNVRTASTLILLLAWVGNGHARVYKTQKQALSEAFPGSYQRKSIFLTEEQAHAVEKQARSRLESRIVTYYEGKTADGNPAGLNRGGTHACI